MKRILLAIVVTLIAALLNACVAVHTHKSYPHYPPPHPMARHR